MKIWVVVIGQGAYSDRIEWPAAAFSTETAAKQFLKRQRTQDRVERTAFYLKTYNSRPSRDDFNDYRIDEIGLDQEIEPKRGEEE